MAKILIVDDDPDTVEFLTLRLSEESHLVESAATGSEAMNLLTVAGYDVVILDWDLSDMPGTDVLNWYKSRATGRVLMLTGKASYDDREQGLDAGADDYLVKPFSMKELAARVRALLRRPVFAIEHLRAGEYTLDSKTLTASRDGEEIRLTPREFALIEFFVRHPGQIFSTEAIVSRVWPSDTEATSEALRSTIKRLRQKLGDKVIEYVAGAGYQLGKR